MKPTLDQILKKAIFLSDFKYSSSALENCINKSKDQYFTQSYLLLIKEPTIFQSLIVSSNGKFVIKTLLSSLSQQLSLPLVNQAINYVNENENSLEAKVINFWNSVGDMLNKKFKGKVGRSSNHIKKSTTKKKSDKTEEHGESYKRVINKEEVKIPFTDFQSQASYPFLNSYKLDAQKFNKFIKNDDSPKYFPCYKPTNFYGNPALQNFRSNMIYSNVPNTIYFRMATCNPVPTKHVFNNNYISYPQLKTAGSYFYIPIHQN